MLALRKAHKTLVYGDYQEFLPQHPDVYFYERKDEEGHYLVLLNLSSQTQSIFAVPNFQEAFLLIVNYKEIKNPKILRPWEARVYWL